MAVRSDTRELDSFMATMVAQSIPLPTERAVALARERFGLDARASRLTGERDENFKLTLPGGTEYVLKVANAAESAAATNLQIAALLHLERTESELPVPRILRTLAGDVQVRFQDPSGIERTARILSFLPGRLLEDSARSSPQLVACGRLGGRLSRALGTFEHPAARRAVIWDVRHVGYLSRLLTQMPHFAFRARALELLNRIVPVVDGRFPMLRRQVVHNDLNPRNILVDPQDGSRILGIIDFGDLTHTALIADLAVAGAELIPRECADVTMARDCVLDVARAYHECMPLLAAELAILASLVATRLAMNIVVHEWHVDHNPSNQHFAALDAGFMSARLDLANRLLDEEFRL
jgi:hydroxylysine kinase